MDKIVQKYVIERYEDKARVQGYIDRTEKGLTAEEKVIADKFMRKGSALDVGCGTGREALALGKIGFKVTAIDISNNMVNIAKRIAKHQNITFKTSDILDYNEMQFDNVIFFNNIFEQIPTYEGRIKSLDKAYTLLKKGGIFVLTTHSIFVPGKYGYDYAQAIGRALNFYAKRIFGKDIEERNPFDLIIKKEKIYAHFSNPLSVKRMLRKIGFKIIYVNAGNNIALGKAARIRYLLNEPVYYVCTK